jgi:PRC-barrel domain protein
VKLAAHCRISVPRLDQRREVERGWRFRGLIEVVRRTHVRCCSAGSELRSAQRLGAAQKGMEQMDRIHSIGIASGVAALLIAPALAQAPPASPPRAADANQQRPANATLPVGSVLKSQDDWRGRTVIGAAVFDDNGRRIATINDLLITDDGRVDQAVLSVGRVSRKLVAVPFEHLRFEPSRLGGMPMFAGEGQAVPAVPGDIKTYGAVLPGATTDSLAKMEAFRFAP